ncbi:acetoin utilization protein acetyltransferase AcuA [Barrientosiimonas marina]|uniref:GNAT family N-acetyltransferase n=1 Tax=Lentibacillus kimchii TaxID=1542911 RepID=A0ABW2UVP9_9BACI
MKHTKTCHAKTRMLLNNQIVIEGPLSSEQLKLYHFHEDLAVFRPAPKQFDAILNIADFPEGRLIVARTKDTIIGYVTYLHPDPMERWSAFKMENLMELGVVEVIPAYRSAKVASDLLTVSMTDDYMENYIIISTEYYWHWDLKREGLSVWGYRNVMEKMMAAGGLHPAATNDPEIISHPANCLMVRIGRNVPEDSVKQFDRLRFLQ